MKTESYNPTESEYEALYRSVLAAGKSVSYPYFLGTMGALGGFRFCRLDCLCAEKQHPAAPPIAKAAELGVTLHAASGRIIEGPSAPKRKSFRDAMSLTELVANMRSPALPYLCRRIDQPIWQLTGYTAAIGMAAEAGRVAKLPHRAVKARVESWIRSCDLVKAFLQDLSGKQRTPSAVRLRRASTTFDLAVNGCLHPLVALLAQRPKVNDSSLADQAARLLSETGAILRYAGNHILEAACIISGVDGGLACALMLDGDSTLSGTQINELIYLARSASPPFRQLAAESLATAGQAQAVSTLRQLIYDKVTSVALAAATAFKMSMPESWPSTFVRAISDMSEEPSEFPEEVVAGLLLHLVQRDEWVELDSEEILHSLPAAWPTSKLIKACAAPLNSPR